jgi:haloacetate dehalogenase
MELMRSLGFERFDVLAHDRGARGPPSGHGPFCGRAALAILLDIAPTLAM